MVISVALVWLRLVAQATVHLAPQRQKVNLSTAAGLTCPTRDIVSEIDFG